MSTIDMSKETTARSAMKLALEALEYIEHNYMSLPAPAEKAITALREALASEAIEQPAQQHEPVVFYRCNGCGHAYEQVHPTSCDCMEADGFDRVEYYTSPPAQRTWVGLTNKDVYECEPKKDWYDSVEFARAIEAKLKAKNFA